LHLVNGFRKRETSAIYRAMRRRWPAFISFLPSLIFWSVVLRWFQRAQRPPCSWRSSWQPVRLKTRS